MELPIPDRITAGKALSRRLLSLYKPGPELIVLALPRGGVPVAFEVAEALGAELDVMIVRKLGAPMQPELAMGAIAGDGIRVMNEDVVTSLRITDDQIESVMSRENDELERRVKAYRGDRPWPDLSGRTVMLVDDGVATGATMFAAIDAVRASHAAEVVVAIPIAPAETVSRLEEFADKVICLATPEPFFSIGQWYQRFDQVSDAHVVELLQRRWQATQNVNQRQRVE